MKQAMGRRITSRWAGLTAIVGVAALAVSIGVLGGTEAAAKSKSSQPTVTIVKVKGLGKVLADGHGNVLYTLTNNGQAVDCTGSCADAWPFLLLTKGSTPKGAKGVTGLALVAGTKEVSENGVPLHAYSSDAKSGEASGEGVSSFGVWHVVKAPGSSTSATTAT
jgi:predicted lipoprotein with Yx(FWY)xxD motif